MNTKISGLYSGHATLTDNQHKMPSCLSEVLNSLMSETNIDSANLSKHTGIPIPTINRLRNNNQCNPTLTTLVPLADFFNLNINQLIGMDPLPIKMLANSSSNQVKNLPIISIDDAQESHKYLDPHQHKHISTNAHVSSNAFAIIVKGSLITPQFPENTILIFDRHINPRDRDYVIVKLDGHQKPVLRQLLLDGDDHYLKPVRQEIGDITISIKHNYIAVMIQALVNCRESYL